jgi:hypothetical protein
MTRVLNRLWMLSVVAVLALAAACFGPDETDIAPQPTIPASTLPVNTTVPDSPPTSSHPTVFFWPDEIRTDSNGEAKADVWVNAGSFGISGGEVTLDYSNSGCTVQAFTAGTLLGDHPLVGQGNIDNNGGRALLALARVGATQSPTPSGSFASVTLSCEPNTTVSLPSLGLSALMVDHQFEKVPLTGGSAG